MGQVTNMKNKVTPKADAEVLALSWGFHCILVLGQTPSMFNLDRVERIATLAGHYAHIALQEAS